MKRNLAALLGLNILDAATTLYALGSGWGRELNPIMAAAYDVSPYVFLLAKFGLLALAMRMIWSNRNDTTRVSKKIVPILNVVFVGVVLWNAANIYLWSIG